MSSTIRFAIVSMASNWLCRAAPAHKAPVLAEQARAMAQAAPDGVGFQCGDVGFQSLKRRNEIDVVGASRYRPGTPAAISLMLTNLDVNAGGYCVMLPIRLPLINVPQIK
jgi:hypothetical protein